MNFKNLTSEERIVANFIDDDVLVKITPKQMELDTDEPREAEGQKELLD